MQLTKKKGFTLIEIVIVLAIAALILIIVFLGVTGAQRSRRDAQRKTDLDKIAAQLESWASNHNGDYPLQGEWSAFATGAGSYLKLDQAVGARTMGDPNGAAYTTAASASATVSTCATGGLGASANTVPTATVGAGVAYGSGTTTGSNRTYEVRICLEAGDYKHKQ